MKKIFFSLGAIGLAALLWHFGTQTQARETNDRQYWYSDDPDTAVLTVRFAGGRSPFIHRHTVFADGRYEYRRTDLAEQQIFEHGESQLSHEDMTALIDPAVRAGLMEFDREEIEARMRATQPPYIASDAATMFLEIHLERYRGPGSREAEAASHSMSLKDAYFQAGIFPDIEEIQALERIGRTVEEFQRRAAADHAH